MSKKSGKLEQPRTVLTFQINLPNDEKKKNAEQAAAQDNKTKDGKDGQAKDDGAKKVVTVRCKRNSREDIGDFDIPKKNKDPIGSNKGGSSKPTTAANSRAASRRNTQNRSRIQSTVGGGAVEAETPKPQYFKSAKFEKFGKGGPIAKIRIKLPGIEAYEKDLEYPIDGPGRVAVRTERLMGSDMIRSADRVYMMTLMDRLEEEEDIQFRNRTIQRKEHERQRIRQMVIKGYMEPTPDMADLKKHPIYRVNRILNRLANLNFYQVEPEKFPPLTLMEPFSTDTSGEIFKSFPGHDRVLRSNESSLEAISNNEFVKFARKHKGSQQNSSEERTSGEEEGSDEAESAGEMNVIKTNQREGYTGWSKYGDEEWDGEGYEEEQEEEKKPYFLTNDKFIQEALQYGISEDILRSLTPYQSTLVKLVFDSEMNDIDELYDTSTEVIRAYRRKLLTAIEFCNTKLNKML